MEEISELALATNVATRIIDARKFELAIGAGPRFELRYGGGAHSSWRHGAVAGDAVLEVLPRAISGSLGLRLAQDLTDAAKSSSLLLELGFEVR
jgi:hypothetical protein